jgi:hypothetical protein
MTTTTVLSDDTATIVHDDSSRFSWGAVVAGAVIATAVTFFLVSIGSGLGLALTSARSATGAGLKTFITLGAIYFVAAQAFGFAIGGHVTGRLMPPAVTDSEEETFRADAHGLAVWGLAVVFGLALLALTAASTISAGASKVATPANYWADKLLRPAATQQSSLAYTQFAQNDVAAAPDTTRQDMAPRDTATDAAGPGPVSPSGASPAPVSPSLMASSMPSATLADVKDEASRILTVEAVQGQIADSDNHQELIRLVSQYTGLNPTAATDRVNSVENDMRTDARNAAEAAKKAASYISIWTAMALLFGAVVCVAATVSARWKDEHDMFGRPRRIAAV